MMVERCGCFFFLCVCALVDFLLLLTTSTVPCRADKAGRVYLLNSRKRGSMVNQVAFDNAQVVGVAREKGVTSGKRKEESVWLELFVFDLL